MPGMKLYYFKGRGRAEIIRLTLAQGGIEYEDVRMEWPSQQWEELKKGKWHYLIFTKHQKLPTIPASEKVAQKS